MKPTTRAARRGLAAVALTCAAVVIPTTALAASGSPAKPAAGRGPASANRLVTLGRGATAHVLLQITDVASFPPASCGETTAVALRVYPPGATRSLEVPFTFQACGQSGPVYLHVGTTKGGTGIPGFSS